MNKETAIRIICRFMQYCYALKQNRLSFNGIAYRNYVNPNTSGLCVLGITTRDYGVDPSRYYDIYVLMNQHIYNKNGVWLGTITKFLNDLTRDIDFMYYTIFTNTHFNGDLIYFNHVKCFDHELNNEDFYSLISPLDDELSYGDSNYTIVTKRLKAYIWCFISDESYIDKLNRTYHITAYYLMISCHNIAACCVYKKNIVDKALEDTKLIVEIYNSLYNRYGHVIHNINDLVDEFDMTLDACIDVADCYVNLVLKTVSIYDQAILDYTNLNTLVNKLHTSHRNMNNYGENMHILLNECNNLCDHIGIATKLYDNANKIHKNGYASDYGVAHIQRKKALSIRNITVNC